MRPAACDQRRATTCGATTAGATTGCGYQRRAMAGQSGGNRAGRSGWPSGAAGRPARENRSRRLLHQAGPPGRIANRRAPVAEERA